MCVSCTIGVLLPVECIFDFSSQHGNCSEALLPRRTVICVLSADQLVLFHGRFSKCYTVASKQALHCVKVYDVM